MGCEATEGAFREHHVEPAVGLSETERANVLDLIRVLLPYPGGLRRWSIMRAIRSRREKERGEISLKFEDEIERAFRRFCAGEAPPKGANTCCTAENALFHRPKEKAGEVWAVNRHRARAWLKAETGMQIDANR
jgi:hypothetical protein